MLRFPELTPPTIVTRSRRRLRAFLREQGGAIVVKPVDGYGGLGVFVVRDGDPNASSILETVDAAPARAGRMAQNYLPEARAGRQAHPARRRRAGRRGAARAGAERGARQPARRRHARCRPRSTRAIATIIRAVAPFLRAARPDPRRARRHRRHAHRDQHHVADRRAPRRRARRTATSPRRSSTASSAKPPRAARRSRAPPGRVAGWPAQER